MSATYMLIALAIVVIIFVIWLGIAWVRLATDMFGPGQVVTATIQKKSELLSRMNGDKRIYQCDVIVQLDNGTQLEFRVPKAIFDTLSEGQTGLLAHKGLRFIGFVPKSDKEVTSA
jgi:hypothetical protein